MDANTKARLEKIWEAGGHKVVLAVLGFGHAIVFWLVLKGVGDVDAQKSFGLLVFLAGLFVGGVEYLLIDKWLRPEHSLSKTMWVVGIIGAVLAFALAGWHASEEWKSRQPRSEPDYRQQIRTIERQGR